jgi:hypothetical protein
MIDVTHKVYGRKKKDCKGAKDGKDAEGSKGSKNCTLAYQGIDPVHWPLPNG